MIEKFCENCDSILKFDIRDLDESEVCPGVYLSVITCPNCDTKQTKYFDSDDDSSLVGYNWDYND